MNYNELIEKITLLLPYKTIINYNYSNQTVYHIGNITIVIFYKKTIYGLKIAKKSFFSIETVNLKEFFYRFEKRSYYKKLIKDLDYLSKNKI